MFMHCVHVHSLRTVSVLLPKCAKPIQAHFKRQNSRAFWNPKTRLEWKPKLAYKMPLAEKYNKNLK